MKNHWASHAVEALQRGEQATIKPRGHSMKPKVMDGATVTLAPVEPEAVMAGDIVLVKVKGRVYLHLVKARCANRYQIGNNRGHINGWVGPSSIYGKAVEVQNP